MVNGKGKGSNLGDISKVEKALNQLNCNDYFLNNVTGDLFQYNYEHDNWRPFANAGIHNFLCAEKNQVEGPFILRKEKYRIDYSKKNNVYISKNTEQICYTIKRFINIILFGVIDAILFLS